MSDLDLLERIANKKVNHKIEVVMITDAELSDSWAKFSLLVGKLESMQTHPSFLKNHQTPPLM